MTAKSPRADELEPVERASTDELRALQLDRLRWSLAHAYENVPHYRKAFDAKGVHPRDLASLEDLARFPFSVKTDLRDNYPFAMFAVPLAGLRRAQSPPPWWVKLCAVSGFLMTALYIGLSVLPIIPVGSRTQFALKITGLIVVTNLIGVALLVSARKRSQGQQS